ncbi:PhzF family phenazine biosynthesis protein [Lysobacter niastensis]|uniref:PhzF family phenazine biosynthesis protein n=1 Tax=Lysobacter niastensis TaxID=380629 RepID=A0ABS0B787_9GAMM|nr:PhzF family phenazine biosynthesis protein [Lysobacter niastensis]MBF6024894.1 PhzF family phenazine biosynthesis protein [Lysobacter niastensis]
MEVHIVNAFTADGRGGNPAGVVLDADRLDAAARLAVAGRVGLSETAFVSRSEHETVRLEFFTPTRQIAHCGHATIATFALLRELGRVGEGVLSKETIDGRREVIVEGDTVWMEQRSPRYEPIDGASALGRSIAASLGISGELRADVVDTGNRFAVVEVDGARALSALRPDFRQIGRISEELDLIGYYVFSRRDAGEGRVATTRMFAPRYGIEEEPATGMAAGPLACLLFREPEASTERATEWTIEQGRFMSPPSPSALRVRLELADDRITRLFAGGCARVERRMLLEEAVVSPGAT